MPLSYSNQPIPARSSFVGAEAAGRENRSGGFARARFALLYVSCGAEERLAREASLGVTLEDKVSGRGRGENLVVGKGRGGRSSPY